MGREENMEMERSRRQFEHEKKFGKTLKEPETPEDERYKRNESMLFNMRKSSRGFHHSDIHKAAEELRMEGKGSIDPHYEDSKKNK